MLNIQVLGKGLIPRGLGIAPRMEPFPADYTLISTIMNTRGLKVNMINPEDGKAIELTPKNVKRMWDKYGNNIPKKSRAIKVNMPPQQEDKEKKEPQVYTPVNQNPNQYKEVSKDLIHQTVQSVANSVLGTSNQNVSPQSIFKTDDNEKPEGSENKTDESIESQDKNTSGTDNKEDKEKKEDKPDDKKDDNGKNNSGKNQPFKPINNPKK